MAELRFEAVTKRYGAVDALRGFDIVAGDGELLTLVGPSGSGKTTALRVAAGLEDATEGSVWIRGREVTHEPPAKRNVSMVFQGFALFPHLKAGDNIGFGLRARGVPRGEAAGRVRAAAELVGCAELLERRPHELSGGERQRVALARSLVREPDVFLLDEPLSNLDPQVRAQMRGEIRRLHDRVGATMIHVTHDQVEALTLGDRVAVMRDGRIQQVAKPDEIYRRPANRFVATFVGSPAMNMYAATLQDGRLHAGPFVTDPPAGLAADAARLEAGVRPEDVIISPPDPGGSATGRGAAAHVQLVEVAGGDTFVHLSTDQHAVVVRGGPDLRPAVGETLGVDVRPGRVHVFDADSGARLG